MTRTMYDSLNNLDKIPWKSGDLIMAYINGSISYNNYNQARTLWPQAQILTITVNGDPAIKANICDCENGDYTPQLAADWANQGSGDTIYSSTSQWPTIFDLLKVPCHWLAATLDGQEQDIPGSVGNQWYTNGLYDQTTIYDNTWFPSTGGNEMNVIEDANATFIGVVGDGGVMPLTPPEVAWANKTWGPTSTGMPNSLITRLNTQATQINEILTTVTALQISVNALAAQVAKLPTTSLPVDLHGSTGTFAIT